ncbi:MAG: heavy-metal-associated domain-containing protein [Candidatus Kapaibacteriota bacterium]
MKRNFLSFIFLTIICFFTTIAVTLSADELSTTIFKVDSRGKDAKVKIETVVSLLKGVSEATFDLVSKKLEVKFDPK